MTIIKLNINEPFELAFRRFKRACEKSGILSEVKKREFYEKPSVKRKKSKVSSIKRYIKKHNKKDNRY